MSGQGDSHIYKSSAGISKYVHIKSGRFQALYQKLPLSVQKRADKQFKLLKENPNHGSLRFEKLKGYDNYWSASVTWGYRAVAIKDGNIFVWTWIGKHDVYDWLER